MSKHTSALPDDLFQALVEQTLAGIYIIQQGQFQYVNPQFAKMFGYASPDEIIRQVPIVALIADADVQMVSENVRRRELGEVKDARYRFRAKRKDGSTFHVEVHGKSSSYMGERAVIGVLIDVTHQIETEQCLRERDSKIQALFDGNVIGILCWDSQGYIYDANQACRHMLELTDDDFTGRGLSWKSFTPLEYHDLCIEHVSHILRHGRGIPVQKEYLSRSGERIPVLVNGVRLGDGDVCSGISFVLDLRNVRHLESERDKLAAMVEHSPAAMFVQDIEGRFVYLNAAARAKSEAFGGLMGKTEFDYMEAETAMRVAMDRERILRTGELEQFEEEIRYPLFPDTFYFRTTKWPLHNAFGRVTGLAGIVVNISTQKKIEAELAHSKNLMNTVFENMPLIALLQDRQGRVISSNSRFSELYGLSQEQALGKHIWELLPQLCPKELQQAHEYVLSTGRSYIREAETIIDGKEVCYLMNLFPVRDAQDHTTALCALIQDMSAVQQARHAQEALAQAEFESLHDGLTGLPNRKLLLDRIEQQLVQAKRDRQQFVVCFIDLDHFKEVNDTLGHAAGDELLRELAKRMSSCIRASDTLGRIGGDEFLAILRGDPMSKEIQSVIDRIVVAVSQPVLLKQGEVSLSCSIGSAGYPNDGQDIETLMIRSDAMMYRKKAERRGATPRDLKDKPTRLS